MIANENCATCPVSAGFACLGRNVPSLCSDPDPRRRDQLRHRAEGIPMPPPRPPTRAEVSFNMRVELCPMGSGPCGCGSGPPRRCSHPDRPAAVRRRQCRQCVASAEWEAGVESPG